MIATVLPNEGRNHLQLPRCYTYDLDVTDDASVKATEESIRELTGGYLDILVNNA